VKRIVLIVVSVLLAAVGAAGCGSRADDQAAAPTSTIAKLLGHEPTGLAKQIADSGTMTVANDPDYAPQSSLNAKSGEMEGFDVDVAKRVGELLGVKVAFVNPPWESIQGKLKSGEFDVSIGSMTVTDERAKKMDFAEPYYYSTGIMVARKGQKQISSVEDLFGQKVGADADSSYASFLKQYPKIKLTTYSYGNTGSPGLNDLKAGKIDYFMEAAPYLRGVIADDPTLELSGPPLYSEDLAFAIRKGEPDLLAVLNAAVRTMHEDGSLSAASQKWYDGLDLTAQ